MNSFKTYLNRNTLPANPFFYYGDRKSQILHTRLGLKYSSLNNRLFLKYIVDSSNCVCGENESNHQYLFESLFIITYVLTFSTNFVKSLVVSACKLYFLVTTPNL